VNALFLIKPKLEGEDESLCWRSTPWSLHDSGQGASPATLSRQVAMYIANQGGGRSTTQIGKFYNARDHSTVCYAIARIRVLRETNPEDDGLLTVLTNELRDRAPSKSRPRAEPDILSPLGRVGSID
jgi:hypothetical protein